MIIGYILACVGGFLVAYILISIRNEERYIKELARRGDLIRRNGRNAKY